MAIMPNEAIVLVVEDNPDNLFILMDLLQEELHVHYCNGRASGQQLFKLLHAKPELVVDLILMDLQIPREDGYEILQRIRAMPALARTIVVAVTANVMPQDVARARQAGFDGFIGKPINRHRFPEQIGRILRGEAVWEAR